jgi:hypothetical protein
MDEIDSKETFHYMANPDTRTKHVTTSSNSIYFIDLAFVIEYETLCLKRGDNPITVGWFMLFNATFNNISAISRLSVLLVVSNIRALQGILQTYELSLTGLAVTKYSCKCYSRSGLNVMETLFYRMNNLP